MTTSRKAKIKAYASEVRAIRAKYEDRGSSGEKQMLKELDALDSKYNKDQIKRVNKGMQDEDNIIKYGKDAMKGKSFAKYNKGGMAKKKMGYSKGGMCGASNPAARPMKKGK
jgi:hypothetical protein